MSPSIDDVQAVNWALTATAVALTGGRLAIRWSNARRFYGDDCANVLALVLLIIHGATNQVTLDAKARQKIDIAPSSHVPTATLIQEYAHLRVLNTVNNVFLYAIMWIIKVAFLLCYRQVFKCNKTFLRAWWIVLAFTILSYIPPFVGVLVTCANASTLAEYEACNSNNSFREAKLIYTCVLNVVSDLMVMALPLWMLSQLQINMRQKIGLAFVFCVALFCVALDILRTAESLAENQNLYTVLELNFSVIVFCLPAYRRLLAGGKIFTLRKSRSGSSGEHSEQNRQLIDVSRRKSSAASAGAVMEIEDAMPDRSRKTRPSINEAHYLVDIESHSDEKSLAGSEQRPALYLNR